MLPLERLRSKKSPKADPIDLDLSVEQVPITSAVLSMTDSCTMSTSTGEPPRSARVLLTQEDRARIDAEVLKAVSAGGVSTKAHTQGARPESSYRPWPIPQATPIVRDELPSSSPFRARSRRGSLELQSRSSSLSPSLNSEEHHSPVKPDESEEISSLDACLPQELPILRGSLDGARALSHGMFHDLMAEHDPSTTKMVKADIIFGDDQLLSDSEVRRLAPYLPSPTLTPYDPDDMMPCMGRHADSMCKAAGPQPGFRSLTPRFAQAWEEGVRGVQQAYVYRDAGFGGSKSGDRVGIGPGSYNASKYDCKGNLNNVAERSSTLWHKQAWD